MCVVSDETVYLNPDPGWEGHTEVVRRVFLGEKTHNKSEYSRSIFKKVERSVVKDDVESVG